MTLLRNVVQVCISFIITAVEFADISKRWYSKFYGLTSTEPANYRAILKHVLSYAIDTACTETKHLCVSHTRRKVNLGRHAS